MAYSADSFVADEVPTTAKWNKLWNNDASFNDGTGIATGAITSAKISGIDKSLTTTDSNPYKFRAYHNTTQNSGSGAFAKASFNTENYDTNSNFASSTYTAPVAGFYMFGARVHTISNPTRLLISIYKNGSEAARGTDIADDDAQASGSGVSATSMLQISASDTVEAYTFGNTALTLSGNSELAYFWGVLLSRT